MERLKQIYQMGKAAAMDGQSDMCNPFHPTTQVWENQAWYHGWWKETNEPRRDHPYPDNEVQSVFDPRYELGLRSPFNDAVVDPLEDTAPTLSWREQIHQEARQGAKEEDSGL